MWTPNHHNRALVIYAGSALRCLIAVPYTSKSGHYQIISGDTSGKIQAWDSLNGTLIRVFDNEHSSTVENFELLNKSSGSMLLISCSLDKTIVIWSLSTGTKILKLTDHNERIYALKLIQSSPKSLISNEDFLASASMDNVIKIWNVNDWSLVHSINTSHTEGFFWSLESIRRDEDNINEFILISGGLDGFIKTWKVSKTGFNFLKTTNTGSSIWALTAFKTRIVQQIN